MERKEKAPEEKCEVKCICAFDLDAERQQFYHVIWKNFEKGGTWQYPEDLTSYSIKNFWIQMTRFLKELNLAPRPLSKEDSDLKTMCERNFTLRRLLDDEGIELKMMGGVEEEKEEEKVEEAEEMEEVEEEEKEEEGLNVVA